MSPYAPKPGDPLSSLDTPTMLVNLPLMEQNIATLFAALLPTGVRIRPHLKTTKSVHLARVLAKAGATGACVAKLAEAEVIAGLGFEDLLITCVIVGAVKVRRLVALFKEHRQLRIVVDDAGAASAIDAALGEAGFGEDDGERLMTLIDLDVGLHRTGVQPGEPALALARHVAGLKHLKLIGVQGYEGHVQHVHGLEERKAMCLGSMKILTETAEALRGDGHHGIEVVTTGGTGTAEFCAAVPGVTEVQPGSFLFMDTDYRNAVGTTYKNSLTILSTVLSAQGPRCVTIDAGLKSLTTDSGLAECKENEYTYGVLGDEHGSLSWEEGGAARALSVGDRVEMVPSHIDPTVNLHDFYVAHRDGVVEEVWKVDARGCVQ